MINQTIDGVPRRICHACVTYPRDAYCPVCDPTAQGEPVAWRVTGHGGLTVTPEYPRWATGKGSEGLKVEALVVAEQPAPVAVALSDK